MDKNTVCRIIKNVVTEKNLGNAEVFFEADGVHRIEVVSDKFKGMRLLKRIDLLTDAFIDLMTTELADFQIVFNPLTENEKLKGESELKDEEDTSKPRSNGIATASAFY